MAITPISVTNVSKKMIAKKGSAVNELVQRAMNDFGGITPTKAKIALPKPIESDQILKGEIKKENTH